MTTGDDQPNQLFDWPGERRFYLTLDLECDYGTALGPNRYEALERVEDLVSTVESHAVPLTVFVQTEVLDERPDAVESLRNADVAVEFHTHGYSHAPRSETSVPEEVSRSTARFTDFFETEPKGYRFPNGNVRRDDYVLLAEAGYEFDASCFPSWRPGHFDNRNEPTVPSRQTGGVYEVPFTVLSDRLRIPTSLSYCRLFGRPLLTVLTRFAPSSVVFNIHMHDLFNPDSAADLPPLYRGVYARNADGFGMLDRVLGRFATVGYSFERFERLVDELSRSTPRLA
jgi:peptidoglycan/xylan/chitin deacetylase (PgdA/CDA1 family)